MCYDNGGMNDDRKRITEAILQYRKLVKQRDALEIELSRLRSFIRAAAGILPPKDRPRMEKAIAEMFSPPLGITDAVRIALRSHPGKWMSAPIIRKYLEEIGFDFSRYTTNALTSIHTVAKRLILREEVHPSDFGVSYRWRKK